MDDGIPHHDYGDYRKTAYVDEHCKYLDERRYIEPFSSSVWANRHLSFLTSYQVVPIQPACHERIGT